MRSEEGGRSDIGDIEPHEDFRYAFTVFTPTFNRRHTLHRVYESLLRQTFRDFEWLVVDDGSTDGTSQLVASWQAEAWFPVRYVWQANSGKPAAMNRGASLAQGRFFTVLDSDDACVADALERLKYHWDQIPGSRRTEFVGVCGLVKHPDGRLEGQPFPTSPYDSTALELRIHGEMGEKWGFMRTDVMREFPFPTIPYEQFAPQSLVWNRIARRYMTRYVNEVYRIYYASQNGLSSSLPRIRNPVGMVLYYTELIETGVALRWHDAWRVWVNRVRYGLHAGESLARQFSEAASKPYWLAAVLPGMAIHRWDRHRLRIDRTKP